LLNINEIDTLVTLAKDADSTLTQNTRKIVLDMLYQDIRKQPSDFDKILSLTRFSKNETLKKIGTNKDNQITQSVQKNKELSAKVSQCVSKINQMSYDSLLVVIEQHSIGGANTATNYILTGTRILKITKH
jgi:hypothetical protein